MAFTVVGAIRRSPLDAKRLVTVVAVIAAVSAAGIGTFLGAREFHDAYSRCVADGVAVQAALRAHHHARGAFPVALKALDVPLPCQVAGRGTILEYHRSPTGYRISFRDWLGECVGSEVEPLACHK